MTLFQHHLLALALASATTGGFGLFVLWKNPERSLHRSMTLYCFSLAWWSGWECAALQMSTRELAFFLMRIEYVGVAFISTLFCTTVSYLLDFQAPTRRRFLLPLYVFSIISIFFLSIHPMPQFLHVTPGPIYYLPFWAEAGRYYWIFLAFWISTAVIGHALIFYKWHRTRGEERTRLFLFLVGTFAAYLSGCPEFALKYGVRLGWLNPFGLYVFPFYNRASLLRHRSASLLGHSHRNPPESRLLDPGFLIDRRLLLACLWN